MKLGEKILKNINEIQKSKAISDKELALKLSTTANTVRSRKVKIKNGINVGINTINQIATALEVDIKFFFE